MLPLFHVLSKNTQTKQTKTQKTQTKQTTHLLDNDPNGKVNVL